MADRSCMVDAFSVWAIFRSYQWSTTGPPKAVVCAVPSVRKCIKKDPLLLVGKSSQCGDSGFPLKNCFVAFLGCCSFRPQHCYIRYCFLYELYYFCLYVCASRICSSCSMKASPSWRCSTKHASTSTSSSSCWTRSSMASEQTTPVMFWVSRGEKEVVQYSVPCSEKTAMLSVPRSEWPKGNK